MFNFATKRFVWDMQIIVEDVNLKLGADAGGLLLLVQVQQRLGGAIVLS